jgi:restriction system protein
MLPVLLASVDGEVRVGDVVEKLAQQLGLSQGERTELLPSGKTTVFSNRVHWAKTYLSKAGLIESTRRGHFKITLRGQQVINSQPSRIDNSFLGQFDEFRKFTDRPQQDAAEEQPPASTIVENRLSTPDEVMRKAHRQIETSLAEELLDRIRSAPPEFFERLIVNLLLGQPSLPTAYGPAQEPPLQRSRRSSSARQ